MRRASCAKSLLAAEWDERVVRAYREAAAPAGTPALLLQIEHCEQWMKQRPLDAELALTLGTLCLKQNRGQGPAPPGAGFVGCERAANGARRPPEAGADARCLAADGTGRRALPAVRLGYHPVSHFIRRRSVQTERLRC